MMSCAEAARIMSDRMNGAARRGERLRLRLHLLMCAGCQQYWKQLAWLRRWLRAGHLGQNSLVGSEPVHLEVTARRRIEETLQAELKRTGHD